MSPSETSRLAASNRVPFSQPTLETFRTAVLSPVRAFAFWTAIALPLLYVPMLFTGVVWDHPLALLALFLVNGVALLLGHGHAQPDDDRTV